MFRVRDGFTFQSSWTKTPHKILAVVLAGQRGSAGGGIEGARFRPRRIVEEIPDVEETEVRPRNVWQLVQVIQTREFAAEFDGVIAGDLGGHVAVGVGPLVETLGPGAPKFCSVMVPMVPTESCGNPKGSCGLMSISFHLQPAALARASFRKVGEKV